MLTRASEIRYNTTPMLAIFLGKYGIIIINPRMVYPINFLFNFIKCIRVFGLKNRKAQPLSPDFLVVHDPIPK